MDTFETIGSTIDHHTEKLDKKVDQVGQDAHQAIDSATNAAKPAVERLNQTAHETVDKLMRAASMTAESVAAKSEQLMDAQERFTEECRVYVRQKPVTALAVAVGAGFLLSKFMRKKN